MSSGLCCWKWTNQEEPLSLVHSAQWLPLWIIGQKCKCEPYFLGVRKTRDGLTWCSSVEAACQSEEPFTAESFCKAANQSPSLLKRLRVIFILVSHTWIRFIFDMKACLWTVAEEGCSFYCGHESFHDGGGAADFRGGSQGDQERQARYTHARAECLFFYRSWVLFCFFFIFLWCMAKLGYTTTVQWQYRLFCFILFQNAALLSVALEEFS